MVVRIKSILELINLRNVVYCMSLRNMKRILGLNHNFLFLSLEIFILLVQEMTKKTKAKEE